MLLFFLLSILWIQGQEIHPSYFRVLTLGSQKTDLFFSQVTPPAPDPGNPKQSVPPSPDFTETPVPVSGNARSPFIAFKKDLPLYFLIHDGALYKTVTFIKSLEDLSLLLIQPGISPDEFTITVLRDDPVSFPGGAFEVVNLSSQSVIIRLSSECLTINRLDNRIIIPHVKEGDRFPVELFRADQQRQYSNVAKYNKHLRFIMFPIDAPGAVNNIEFEKLIDSPDTARPPITNG